MILIKRIVADIRGPDQGDSEVEMMVNQELIALQTNQDKTKAEHIKVLDITEITKDSGIQNFVVKYDDTSLDIKKKK